MNKPIKRILLILLLLIVLPILVVSVNEIISLDKNEKIIEEIYTNQLEAILFSVNQYSEDVIRNWTAKIELTLIKSAGSVPHFEKFFWNAQSVYFLFFADSGGSNIELHLRNKTSASVENKPNGESKKPFSGSVNNENINRFLESNRKVIDKLYVYKNDNYQKIEPLTYPYGEGEHILLFILESGKICGIGITRDEFVTNTLSNKLQTIASNDFILSVFDPVTKRQVYNTEAINLSSIEQQRNLWLFPEYSLGILLKGKTISSLVNDRIYTMITMIGLLSVLMIIAGWFVYRNIKKEVQLAQIKSDFVSNVSHELRTPLSLISMFSETLEMERVTSEEKRQEYYKIISGEAARLSGMVNRILSFSQIEAGKKKYNFEETNIDELIKEIANSYSYHLKSKGFEFVLKTAGDLPVIMADKEVISEAVINLVDNAVKYSEEKKYIEIKTYRRSNYVCIDVRDKGIGIEDTEKEKIFEKFYRASKGAVHNTKGSGLGLTLVQHIVEVHNGKVELRSAPGEGSCFTLCFPVGKKEVSTEAS